MTRGHLVLCAALVILSGCTSLGKARRHEKVAEAALQASKHAKCGVEYTKAIANYKAAADSWSPDTPQHWGGIQGMADSYRGRAQCRKGQGDLAAAISDLEQTIKLYNHISQNNTDIFAGALRNAMERESADVSEMMARWNKELAAKGGGSR